MLKVLLNLKTGERFFKTCEGQTGERFLVRFNYWREVFQNMRWTNGGEVGRIPQSLLLTTGERFFTCDGHIARTQIS